MTNNMIVNSPIQGTAFHCLLWSMIEINKFIKKEKLESKLIGQIHDEILVDTVPDELDAVVSRKYYCRNAL